MVAEKKDYVDAVRGWAIILVITCHVGGSFGEMPYPIKKLTNFGWHGVQMFFLASALTLLMSWHRQTHVGAQSIFNFFVRRFLRIAPMYYFGGILYFFAEPPASGFDFAQAARSFLFINAWNPDWLPTTGRWMVVPGGWSIGVEFTFYLIFPALALLITNLSRALAFVCTAVALAIVMEPIGATVFHSYEEIAVRNFLYFWFFNQLPIFALGFLLYYILKASKKWIASKPLAYTLILLVGFCCLLLAQNPLGGHFGPTVWTPTVLVASVLFMAFILTMAAAPTTLFVHPVIRRMGTLSFSAYVLHFLFVHKLPIWTEGAINVQATGYAAIGNGVLLWAGTMVCTVTASHVSYRLIEEPGIAFAHRITASRGSSMQRNQVLESGERA